MKLTTIPIAVLGLCAHLLVPVARASPIANQTAGRDVSSARFVGARQAPAPAIPKYAGPIDPDDELPSFEGTFEYAIANWPDPERTTDSVFWTGTPGGVDKGAVTSFIAQQLGGKGLWFEDVFRVAAGESQAQYIRDATFGKSDAVRWKATARASQAFAAYSSGTVWLLIPKGVSEADPYPGKPKADGGSGRFANWVFFEYNTLTRNALVKQIVRVNPADFADQTVIWTEGDPPFGSVATTASDTPPRWASYDAEEAPTGDDAADDGT